MFTRNHIFDLAQRYIGMREIEGQMNNPSIMAMLTLDNFWPEDDETPWCAAFANYICWLARAPRSKSLRARSFLGVGRGIDLGYAEPGDIIILKRGKEPQPGPEVIEASGHVGFYAGYDHENNLIEVLGGNQSDSVKISRYPASRLLGVRRLD